MLETKMSENNQQKVVSLLIMLLLVTVSPTLVLSSNSDTVRLAQAQSANQTSSSATTAVDTQPPLPSPTSTQSIQNTFHAKGIIGTLVLDPNEISDVPPPSKFFGTIVGGNWSLDVVDRSIQNLTVNLLSIRPNGTIAEAALISTITNDTAVATSDVSLSNVTTTSVATSNTTDSNNTSSSTSNNTNVLQGVANISINGTERWRDVPYALTIAGNTLINISVDSTRTENQFGGLPIHGIVMSMTDENGLNLLPGLPYFISGTTPITAGNFAPPPGGAGGGPPPPQFSDESIGTVATNQTCNVTPSIIEEEEEEEQVATTPQATEGPYFVDELLNRSDIKVDPSDGSVQQGIPLTVVLNVYDVNEGICIPIQGALVDVWHANASGAYSDVEQAGTAGTKFLRGYQITDENGTVQFTTIYPGWYQGRTVHLHFKIRMFEGSEPTLEFTSQLYFNDTITDQVYSQPPYSDRGPRDVRNNQDGIFNGASTDGLVQSNAGEHLMFNLIPQDQGYLGTFNIGLKLNQTAQQQQPG
jgi:protocatechuate 3,4-dioxygenase beta subunit